MSPPRLNEDEIVFEDTIVPESPGILKNKSFTVLCDNTTGIKEYGKFCYSFFFLIVIFFVSLLLLLFIGKTGKKIK